jgi:hypothetical protein
MRSSRTILLGLALGLLLATSAFAQGTGRSLDIQPVVVRTVSVRRVSPSPMTPPE